MRRISAVLILILTIGGFAVAQDSVLTLIERYGLEDPVIAPGSFSDPELQQLYDDLIARGSESLEEALMAGALIEEVDIIDLDEAIAATSQDDIRFVYEALRSGSENHLRAFVSQLGDYEPQLLDEDAYDAIVDADARGGRGGGRRVADDDTYGGYRGGRR